MLTCTLLACLAAASAAPAAAPAPQSRSSGVARAAAERPIAIQADQVLLDDGTSIADGTIVIEGGRIRAVGAGVARPADALVIEHDGWASAGLIALHGYSGAVGEVHDPTRSFLPEAEVAWAFDPGHPELGDLAAQGVTTLVLTPGRQNVVAGTSAVVKTAGGRIVSRAAHLVLSFSDDSLPNNRFPTSTTGALAELRRLFAEPQGAIARARSEGLPVLLEADSRADARRALSFAREQELAGAISGVEWLGEIAGDVKAAGLSAVVLPLAPGHDRRTVRSVLALAEAGVPFGFGLESPWIHPAALRFTAAACLRAGLDRARVWRALTSDAARIAGVAQSTGRLQPGRDADVVLWSGDPLDLTSRAVAVFVDGRRARPEGGAR